MINLLDVNALVALGFLNHEFHARVASWVQHSGRTCIQFFRPIVAAAWSSLPGYC
jgi:predicted nucleic acid-binding protein